MRSALLTSARMPRPVRPLNPERIALSIAVAEAHAFHRRQMGFLAELSRDAAAMSERLNRDLDRMCAERAA